MDDREILRCYFRNGDMRNPFRGRRQRRKKRERKMPHSISKLRTTCPVPGIDGVERFELWHACPFHHAHQIQAGIGDSAGMIGKTDQGQHPTRSPDFGISARVSRAGCLERREGKDNVADRAGADEEATTGDKIACPTPTIG
jgi:hypothetical protein